MLSVVNYLIIELKDLHDTPPSPSVVRAVKLLLGLQEAAGERFDRLLELRLAEVEDVGKMLAKNSDSDSEPHRTRTCNRLIKSQLLCQLS